MVQGERWEHLTPEQMDQFAADAQNDLVDVDPEAIEKVATWWKKWYKKAGHKRLGRVLIKGL